MLRPWTEILPLFIVRWLARKCEKFPWYYEGRERRDCNCPRPGVLIYDVEKYK